jgi:hypothetical protein
MGSTRIRKAARAPESSSDTPARTSPGVDPLGSLPQNEIARAQSYSQEPVREGGLRLERTPAQVL